MNEWRRPSGEFENADLGQLGEACTRLSFELRARKVRTPEERLALVDGVADALLRAGERLTPKTYTPHQPENAAHKGNSITIAFGEWHQKEMRAVRYLTIQRAALRALEAEATDWLRETTAEPGRSRTDVAISSDEALLDQLRALDAELVKRRSSE
jgi:hypothetical protein